MKTSKKTLTTVALLAVVVTLLSWSFSTRDRRSGDHSSPYEEDVYTDPQSSLKILTFIDNAGRKPNSIPGAEDVLIKKIPGDNNHLIMMVYYSKENYSAPSVTINNGYTITFKDDGKGYDEKAGDGLYTARVDADVKEFRKQAVDILKQMRDNGYKPYRYVNRELVYDPNVAATFDAQSFDANKAVSIAGVTNGVGLKTPNGQTAQMDLIGKNCVFITNLGVIEDSTRTYNYCTQKGNINGAWTFGTIMRQLASQSPGQIATDAALSDFVKKWLNTWLSTQIINGDTVQARSLMNTQILNPWLSKSKGAGNPKGQLDMRFAPFKLTAIANRFDLRAGNPDTSPREVCGEGRLIYCLINSNCTAALNMTIIFEYAVYKPNYICDTLLSWAQQWFNLKNLTIGSSTYNQALQAITDQFTLCGTNPLAPNQSSLAQLRTNEITLSPSPKLWELKEFHIDSTGDSLLQTTVGQAPADKYDSETINSNVQRMVSFVNQNAGAIVSHQYTVPAQWQGFGFLGAASHILQSPTGKPVPPLKPFHWDGTDSTNKPTFIKSDNARADFSLQTCNGCHAGETQTSFTHVDPVFFGTEATLSGFLTGVAGKGGAIDSDTTANSMGVKDPALRPSGKTPTIRSFNDINRRAQDLKAFVNTTCGSVLGISAQLMFQPVNMVD